MMISQGFPRNRYDTALFVSAFSSAEILARRGQVYASFVYDRDTIEVHFPDQESTPVPNDVYSIALNVCKNIRELDNLVQESCERDARRSSFDESNFKLRIACIKVYPDRIQIEYWGEFVNTQWDAEFIWDENGRTWTPMNL